MKEALFILNRASFIIFRNHHETNYNSNRKRRTTNQVLLFNIKYINTIFALF